MAHDATQSDAGGDTEFEVDDATPTLVPHTPLIVLVHGAWHGAWCWTALQAALDGRGIASIAIDLPGHGASTAPIGGLHDDVAALTAVLDQAVAPDSGPVILVGHSYGGAVITQAAAGRDDVAHLLYVAAFALDAGESVLSCLGSLERRDVDLAAAMIPTNDGSATTLDPAAAAAALYGECSAEVIRAALARLGPQSTASMTEPIDGAPRRSAGSSYILCQRDRAVHPDHQAALATRCSRRFDLDTGHSPFLSAVDDTANIVQQIVDEISDATP